MLSLGFKSHFSLSFEWLPKTGFILPHKTNSHRNTYLQYDTKWILFFFFFKSVSLKVYISLVGWNGARELTWNKQLDFLGLVIPIYMYKGSKIQVKFKLCNKYHNNFNRDKTLGGIWKGDLDKVTSKVLMFRGFQSIWVENLKMH